MSDLPDTYVPGFHDPDILQKMKYNVFGNTGLKVSQLSLGTGGFCLQYGDYSVESCRETLVAALKAGVNYIDTAPWYGHGVSEEVLGKCLEGIPRKAYYVATKVGRYEKDPKLMFDFSATKARDSIETSLKKLGVDYIDVIQVHDIEFAPSLEVVWNETLPVLEDAVKSGKARFIGVTGYPVSTLKECIEKSPTKIDMVLSYTRLSLFDNTLKEYIPFFQSKNLGIVNACAHGMGLLTSGGPQDWHPAHQDIKDVCSEAREYSKSQGVELGKLALYYSLNQQGPHTHLVGVNTTKLLEYNLDVVFNGLSEKEVQVLDYLQKKVFVKLKKGHWEGVELANRRKILAELATE